MSGAQGGSDQNVTLVGILSGTMSTTFRRTRRRTCITIAQQGNDDSFFVSRASKVGVTARKLGTHIVLCRECATAMMSGDRMCSFLSRAQCTQQICDRSFKEKRRVKQANNTDWKRGSWVAGRQAFLQGRSLCKAAGQGIWMRCTESLQSMPDRPRC